MSSNSVCNHIRSRGIGLPLSHARIQTDSNPHGPFTITNHKIQTRIIPTFPVGRLAQQVKPVKFWLQPKILKTLMSKNYFKREGVVRETTTTTKFFHTAYHPRVVVEAFYIPLLAMLKFVFHPSLDTASHLK